MKYTVRFAHMKNAPLWKVGDILKYGDVIGTMGTTGQSTALHVHIDCVVGQVNKPFKLTDIGTKFAPSKRQLDYFIDQGLFKVKPIITTQFLDPEYKKEFGKDHPAYDVVPEDRKLSEKHFDIHWNRSMIGTVELVVFQPESYGNCIYISFDA